MYLNEENYRLFHFKRFRLLPCIQSLKIKLYLKNFFCETFKDLLVRVPFQTFHTCFKRADAAYRTRVTRKCTEIQGERERETKRDCTSTKKTTACSTSNVSGYSKHVKLGKNLSPGFFPLYIKHLMIY